MVVAIDGPSGAGKSTVARGVAFELGLAYLDTGSTYRAATLAVLRAGADPLEPSAVIEVVDRADIAYVDGVICLEGETVGDDVRSPEVTAAVSAVSAVAGVRHRIVEMQRAWVRGHGDAVVEGRDIGTVVFPDAPVKVYLTARPEVRAARRAGDAEASGRELEDIVQTLLERDRKDSTREVSPLKAAPDATVIDTSEMTAEEVIAAIVGLFDAAQSRAQLK